VGQDLEAGLLQHVVPGGIWLAQVHDLRNEGAVSRINHEPHANAPLSARWKGQIQRGQEHCARAEERNCLVTNAVRGIHRISAPLVYPEVYDGRLNAFARL